MKINALFIVVFALDVTGAFSLAQNSDKPEPPTGDTIIYQQAPPPEVYSTGPAPGAVAIHREGIGNRTGPATFGWIASEMSFEGTIVKGAPYSAEAITETTQTLSDGNRIQRRNSASVFRDSQGRVRREQTLDQIGPWAGSGEALQTTFINDPVAGVKFILDPKERTARKVPMGDFVKSSDAPPVPASGDVRFERKIGQEEPGTLSSARYFSGILPNPPQSHSANG